MSIEKSGNFQLVMKLEDGRQSAVGYFLVEPELVHGENQPVPLSSVICETVLTKCLGNFAHWKPVFEGIRKLRYNMVHFTPVQVVGESGSCYSIADQLKLTDQLADGQNMSEEDKERRLSEFINSYAQQGLFSVCDVVWNHVATNTPWLKDQSDASFNLSNSPHLRPAYCLDRALHRLHRRAMRRCDVINTEEDVDKIIDDLKRKVLPGLKLWEFFVVDIPDQISEFQRLVSAPESVRDAVPIEHQHHPCSNALTDECIIAGDGRRGSKKVRMGCALQLIGKSKESVQEKCVAFRRAIDRFNQSHFEQWKVDQTAILKSLRAALIYERIDPAGPRLDFVDEKSPLFWISRNTNGFCSAKFKHVTNISNPRCQY